MDDSRLDQSAEHVFGGAWTRLKLDIVEQYLDAWHLVMSKQRFQRVFVDAFAGSGKFQARNGAKPIPGSAAIALSKPFDRFVFFEKNRRRATELHNLATRSGKHASCTVLQGDFNVRLPEVLDTLRRPNSRGVLFLDPYGLSVNWETMCSIAQCQTLDVWYLFSLSGLYRQAALQSDRMDAGKEAKLDLLLGTHEWRTALYTPDPQGDMFGHVRDNRTADALALQGYVHQRLQTIFPMVADPLVLRGPSNAPLFSLFFCMGNPNHRAQGIARKIANHLLTPARRRNSIPGPSV